MIFFPKQVREYSISIHIHLAINNLIQFSAHPFPSSEFPLH